MGNFRNLAYFLSAFLLFGVLTFTLERVLDPDRGCLQWDGVRALKFGETTVPSCESTSRLQRLKLAEPLREWVSRLNRLRRLEWLLDSPRSIHLAIETHDPFAYKLEDRQLTIGYAIAEKPGQLERAVLLAWVTRNWPDEDEIAQEVRADLLTWSVIGDAKWSDPTRFDTVETTPWMRYAFAPQSKDGYCRLPFRSVRDLSICNADNDDEFDSRRSLRPLVSWTLWSFVRQLPASKQIHFYKSLIGSHEKIETLEIPEVLGGQGWVQSQAIEYLRHWSLEDDVRGRELKRQFHAEDLGEPQSFDLTVEVPDERLADRALESLKKWMMFSSHRRVLFVSPGRRLGLPEGIPVDLPNKEIQTRRHVILACDFPKSKDMMSLKSKLLYAFKICGEDKLPPWGQLATNP